MSDEVGGLGIGSPVRVHREVSGPPDAPVLVLADSLGSTLAMWEPQLADLARVFRVVRYDLRGHGGSPGPVGPYTIADLGGDLLALLDDLAVERAHVCGLSLGGMIAMWVAAHAPDRVERLVLCATSARLGPPEMWATRARTVLAEGLDAVADVVVGRWFTPAYAAGHRESVDRMRAMFESNAAIGYAGCCGAIESMDLTGDLAAIAAPTLVLVGADDRATPVEHSERIATGIDGARLVVVPDAAHMVNVEQPAAVTRSILDHLGQFGHLGHFDSMEDPA